jgi:DNA-directed RNA polymerase subunit RPC12/RpoP
MIVDGVSQSRDLCSECHQASSPEARDFAAAQREARCEYCGGQPCCGGTDTFAMMTGVQKLKFMCMPCSREHNRYTQQQLQRDASGLSQHEQLAFIRTVNDEADQHMKQWVLDRGSR